MKFIKMHGAGNDYVFVDCFKGSPDGDLPALAREISDRHFGVGADGLILIHPSDQADARMQMFNADGSEAEMCGNGIRCVGKYVYEQGICQQNPLSIETGNGVLSLQLELDGDQVARVCVDMGEPVLEADRIPTLLLGDPVVNRQLTIDGCTLEVTCVSMGNPHCIVFVEELTDELVHGTGPRIELDEHFPSRVNVEFVEVISPGEVRQRTWERGSGETWACGTGASAVCVAGVLSGRTSRQLTNHLLGGDLELYWNEQDNHVYMTGPATEVFRGTWPD
ncbi:MAG: diaminopimelate epimerase [Planctomycetaceae bacterium]|nr:diaminopimelate epimerase [Planctomycetaceae bacterium]